MAVIRWLLLCCFGGFWVGMLCDSCSYNPLQGFRFLLRPHRFLRFLMLLASVGLRLAVIGFHWIGVGLLLVLGEDRCMAFVTSFVRVSL